MWILLVLFASISVIELGLLLLAWKKIIEQDEQIHSLDAVATFYKTS